MSSTSFWTSVANGSATCEIGEQALASFGIPVDDQVGGVLEAGVAHVPEADAVGALEARDVGEVRHVHRPGEVGEEMRRPPEAQAGRGERRGGGVDGRLLLLRVAVRP